MTVRDGNILTESSGKIQNLDFPWISPGAFIDGSLRQVPEFHKVIAKQSSHSIAHRYFTNGTTICPDRFQQFHCYPQVNVPPFPFSCELRPAGTLRLETHPLGPILPGMGEPNGAPVKCRRAGRNWGNL